MPKRITANINDRAGQWYDAWADRDKRSVTSLANAILEIHHEKGVMELRPAPATATSQWEAIARKRLENKRLNTKERTFLSRQGFSEDQINAFDKQQNGERDHAKPC